MLPLEIQIEGRNVEILPEWREKITAELAKIQKHAYTPILHARVTVIGTRHHRHGAFEIHIVLMVPGDTIVMTRQGEYVLPMVVEAFKALDRQVKEYSKVRQEEVKPPTTQVQRGRIVRVFPAEGYGFLETPDMLEVYFHANAVRNGNIKDLPEGMKVEFDQEMGEKGPQATWVKAVA
jgi:cold shock CspA family protein/ribosome-associated translation inhibitor RaiA